MKKNKMLNAVISMILALVMALSLSVTAFAAPRTTGFGILSNILSTFKRTGITEATEKVAEKTITGYRNSLVSAIVNILNKTAEKVKDTAEDIAAQAPGNIPLGESNFILFDGEIYEKNGTPVKFKVEWDLLNLGYKLGYSEGKYIALDLEDLVVSRNSINDPVKVNLTSTDADDATIWHRDDDSGALYTYVPVVTVKYNGYFGFRGTIVTINDVDFYKLYLCTRYNLLTRQDELGTSLFLDPKVTFTSVDLHKDGHSFVSRYSEKTGVGHHITECIVPGCQHSEIGKCEFESGVCTLCGQKEPTAYYTYDLKYSNNINRYGLFRTMFVRPEYHYVYTITVDSEFDISKIKVNGITYRTTDAFGRFVIDNGEGKLNIESISVIDTNGNECKADLLNK